VLCEPEFFLWVPLSFPFNLSHNQRLLITITITIIRIIARLIALKNKQKNEPLFQNVCLQCNALKIFHDVLRLVNSNCTRTLSVCDVLYEEER
jgi:hypothetical protein